MGTMDETTSSSGNGQPEGELGRSSGKGTQEGSQRVHLAEPREQGVAEFPAWVECSASWVARPAEAQAGESDLERGVTTD
jgi:hypothetical protein